MIQTEIRPMTLALFVMIASSITQSAFAEDASSRSAAVKAAEQMSQDAFEYVGITYICKNALGSAHHHAAVVAVEGAFVSAGKSQDDATIIVDDFIKSLKRDNLRIASTANAGKCMDKLLEAQNAFRVSLARFKKAAEADR